MKYIKTYENHDEYKNLFVSHLEKFLIEITNIMNSQSIEKISSEVEQDRSQTNIKIGVRNHQNTLISFALVEIWDRVTYITLLIETIYIGIGFLVTAKTIVSFFEDVLKSYWEDELGCYAIPKKNLIDVMKDFTKEEYMLRSDATKYNL